MQKRETRNILVIGCAHLGMDRDICELFASAADAFGVKETYHLGAILNKWEMEAYHRAVGKSRIYERQIDEVLKVRKMTDKEAKTWDAYIKRLEKEVEFFEKTQAARLEQLHTYFPDVHLVANKEQFVPAASIEKSHVSGHSFKVCKWLTLTSVHANGDRVCHAPVTDRTFNALRHLKTSAIMAHPTPQIRPFQKPGQNQVHHYWTTGMLRHPERHNRPSESFKAMNKPRALLVSIDEDNGEFHVTPLRVDSVGGEPTILVDGLVITAKQVRIAAPEETATLTADEHAPEHNSAVISSVAAAAQYIEAATHIHLGDCGEHEGSSPHTKDKRLYSEGKRISEDFRAIQSMMCALGDFDKRVWVLGNHDKWVQRYCAQHPELIGVADLPTLISRYLADLNLEVHGLDEASQEIPHWGNTALRHGHTENLTKMAQIFGKSVRGHDHCQDEYLDAMTIPTAGALYKPFLGDTITGHTSGFAVGTMANGVSRFCTHLVFSNASRARFCVAGQIYEVEVK